MASKRLKGITLVLDADTQAFHTAFNAADEKAKALSQELRTVNQGLKFNPDSMVLLGQKSELLRQQLEALNDKLAELKNREEEVTRQRDAGKIDAEIYRAYQREIETTSGRIRDLTTAFNDNAEKTRAVETAARDAGRQLDQAAEAAGGFTEKEKEAGRASAALATHIDAAKDAAATWGDIVRANLVADLVADGVQRMAQEVSTFVTQGAELSDAFAESQAKLQKAMENTMGAADGQAGSIAELAKGYEKNGIITAEAQMAGAQELATYLTKKETLEKLLPAMNDVNAQQNGFNATSQETVFIATMMGKVMDGQTGVLSRYGYKFDEVQEKILKTGTEAERAAVLVEVISASVGGMNEALGQTDDGKQARLNATLRETQMQIGDLADGIKNNLMTETLPVVNSLMQDILTVVEENQGGITGFSAALINGLKFVVDNGDYILSFILGVGAGMAAWKATQTVNAITDAYRAWKLATDLAAASQVGLNTAMMAFPGAWAAAIIGGVVTAIGSAVSAWNRHQEALEEERQALLNAGDALRQYGDEAETAAEKQSDTEEIIRKWKALNEVIQTGTLTTQELTEAQAQLAEVEAALVASSEGIITQRDIENGKTEEQIALLQRQMELEKEKAIYALEKSISDVDIDTLRTETESLERKKAVLEETKAALEAATGTAAGFGEEYRALMEKASDGTADTAAAMEDLRNRVNDVADLYGHHYENLHFFMDGTAEMEELIAEALAETRDALITTTDEAIAATSTMAAYSEESRKLAELKTPEVIEAINLNLGEQSILTRAAREETQRYQNALAGLDEQYKNLMDELTETRSGIVDLDEAFSALSDGNNLTMEQLDDLIQKYPEVARYIAETGDVTLQNGEIARLTAAEHRASVRQVLEAEAARLAGLLETAENALEIAKQQYKGMAMYNQDYYEYLGYTEEKHAERQQQDYDRLVEKLNGVRATLASLDIIAAGTKTKVSSVRKEAAAVSADVIESAREAAAEAMAAYESMAQYGGEEAQALALAAKTAAEKAAQAADTAAAATGDAVKDAADAARDAVAEAGDAVKEIAAYTEEYVKAQETAFEAYGNALVTALNESYRRDYENKEAAIQEKLNLVRGAEYDEVALLQDGSSDKVQIMNQEYIEKIRLIDEATAAALEGINAEIQAELDKLGITNAELAAQIQRERDAIQAINDEAEASRRSRQAAQDEAQRMELERRVMEAETNEQREAAQRQLDDLAESIRQRQADNRRQDRLDEHNENIRLLQEQQKAEIDRTKEAIKEAQEAQQAELTGRDGLEQGLETGAWDGETFAENLASIKEQYDALAEDAPRLAAGLVQSGLDGQNAALKILEEFYPNWRNAGKSFIDYYNEGINENAGAMEENMLAAGTTAMERFLEGLQAREPDLLAEAERIAAAIRQTIDAALAYGGPGGGWADSGIAGAQYATGIDAAMPFLARAGQNLGMGGPAAAGAANAAAPMAADVPGRGGNGAVGGINLQIANFNNYRAQNMEALSQELGFYVRQQQAAGGR